MEHFRGSDQIPIGYVVEGELDAGGVGLSPFWGAGAGWVAGEGGGLFVSGVVAGTVSWPDGLLCTV